MPTYLAEKYLLGKELGTGVSCKVRYAKRLSDNKRYAAKIYKKECDFEKLMKTELAIMEKLHHNNVVKLIEHGSGEQENDKKGKKRVNYIILEIAENGELFDFIATTGPYRENIARHHANQFLQALKFMHDNGICHRDIKPENLLLDAEFNIKIADFGVAAPVKGRDGSGKLTTRVGTTDYMAPELHLDMPYDGKADDLFAAGIVIFMMLTARPPFQQATKDDPYYKLLIGKRADLFW
jgi:serine/threonine protein kinase